MKKIIRAKFIGHDGSRGYRTGETYRLSIYQKGLFRMIVILNDQHGGGYCEYQSLLAFLKNWDNIENVN